MQFDLCGTDALFRLLTFLTQLDPKTRDDTEYTIFANGVR
jgi:hypothetical protein